MCARKFDLLGRGIDARNLSGPAAFAYGFREHAAATANVQPAQIRG